MSSAPAEDHDTLVAQLAGLTGLAPSEAEQYLKAANGDIQTAASLFFDGSGPQAEGGEDTTMAHDQGDDDYVDEAPQAASSSAPQRGGGRTLGGAYVPSEPSSSSAQPSSSRQKQPQRGLRTLKDLQGGASGHDDEDDDDDEDGRQHDFFTGGEKSGLAVENPGRNNPQDHIDNIIKRARQNAPRPGGDEERPTSRFHGTGMTLGGDDAPSRAIPDPNAAAPQPAPRVHRELHLWRDGFSVDDGPLYRYDDPANARTLEMINTGHAPIQILNVEHGQEVDVEVHPHKEEDYKKPKKKWVPFSGAGQRLGSPTPGASSTPPPAPAATSSTTSSSSFDEYVKTLVEVDESSPVITLQIRLGDGQRLQQRFNTHHLVREVYWFIDSARPDPRGRPYVLMTTFPSKELVDKDQALGDMPELKRGGVVVQKWT